MIINLAVNTPITEKIAIAPYSKNSAPKNRLSMKKRKTNVKKIEILRLEKA